MNVNYEISPGKPFINDALDLIVKVTNIKVKHESRSVDNVDIEYNIYLEYFTSDEEIRYIQMPEDFDLYSDSDFYFYIVEKALEQYYKEG